MRCPGLHCPGCGDNGLAELLVALGVLVAIGAAIYSAAKWAVANMAWIIGTLAVCMALAVYLALVVVPKLARRRDRKDAAGYEAQRPAWLTAEPVRQIPRTAPPAIEPRREIHLHLNVSPDQLAAIMRHHLEENR